MRCRKVSATHFLSPPQAIPHLHNIPTDKTSFQLARTATHQAHSSSSFAARRRSEIPQRNQFLEWFPFYVHRFIGDVRYRSLKDYQQAWFLNLLFASWISERPGYLPDDGQLWRLANAQRQYFFDKEGLPVLSMFEREGSTTDGGVWIYNRTLLKIYDEQVLKFHKKQKKSTKSTKDENTSYLDFEGTLKKQNGREECTLHPESGLTQWGTCWECYSAKFSAEPQAV